MSDASSTTVYVVAHNRVPGVHAPGIATRACIAKKCTSHTFDWRLAPGSAGNAHRVRAELARTPLGVALSTHYTSEAHLTGYAGLVHERRAALQHRVAKDALPWMRAEGFAGVVSFSDPFRRHALDGTVVHAGHIGGVYQALGARYVGRARPGAMLLLPDGRSLSPRAVAKIRAGHRGREYAAAQLVAAGAPPLDGDPGTWVDTALEQVTRRVRHPGNLKYAWPFGRAAAKAVGEGLPYVKLCDLGLCAGARMHRPTCARAA